MDCFASLAMRKKFSARPRPSSYLASNSGRGGAKNSTEEVSHGRPRLWQTEQARRLDAERHAHHRPVFVLPPRPLDFLRWLPGYFLPWNLLFAASAVAYALFV